MKKSVVLFSMCACLLAASAARAGQWEMVYSLAGGYIMMLEAPDETHVFGYGTMPDPADPQNNKMTGYKMWKGQFETFDPPASGDMFVPSCVQCTSFDRCLMLAMDFNSATTSMKYPFMLSTNGGHAWTTFPDPFYVRSGLNPTQFHAYGTDLVMFFGHDTIALMSHNGGANSKSWFVPTIGDTKYMSIAGGFILNENTGFMVDAKVTEVTDSFSGKVTRTVEPVGTILRTNDLQLADPKDMTWEALATGLTVFPKKLHFASADVGYMITETSAGGYDLLRTADGGRTWTPIVFPQVGEMEPIKWVHDFVAFDETNLIVTTGIPNGEEDEFGVIFTISDGITPVPVLPDPTEHQAAMAVIKCINRYLCYAAGEEAVILKFTDEPPVVVEGEDTGATSEEVDRDAFVADEGGVPMEDVQEGMDLNGWKPPEKDSGCSAGTTSSSGPFGLVLMLLGCAVILGARRSRT